jgi:hypothetical protein
MGISHKALLYKNRKEKMYIPKSCTGMWSNVFISMEPELDTCNLVKQKCVSPLK